MKFARFALLLTCMNFCISTSTPENAKALAVPESFERALFSDSDARESVLSVLFSKHISSPSAEPENKSETEFADVFAAFSKKVEIKKTEFAYGLLPGFVLKHKIGYGIWKVTLDGKIYLTVALENRNHVSSYGYEKNDDLDIWTYKEMNKVVVDAPGLFGSTDSIPTVIFKLINNYWTSMSDSEKKRTQLLITGHSFGGGLAQLIGAYSKSNKFNVDKLWATDERFLDFLKASKVYTFASPQVFVAMKTQNDYDVNWIDPLAKNSHHFIQAGDSLRVHQQGLWRAISYPFKFWFPLFGKIWSSAPLAVWKWFLSFKGALARGILFYFFGSAWIFWTAVWWVVLFFSLLGFFNHAFAPSGAQVYPSILASRAAGLALLALFFALYNSMHTNKQHREYGSIYFSPTANQGYTKKDETFVATRTDPCYKLLKCAQNKTPKALETMVEVHLSNLALMPNQHHHTTGTGKESKPDKVSGQTNLTEQVHGPGNDPEIESGFIKYTIFTTCIFLALLL